MLITHKIEKMDIQQHEILPYLNVVCGDQYTRQLELPLLSGGAEWTVPDGVSAVVRYSRSDGHGGLYDTLPDGSAACSIAGNVVTAVLAPQVLSAPGFAEVSVALVKEEQVLGLFPVGINVKADPSQNVIPAENYYNYPSIGLINAAIGDLDDLETTDKSSLVAAINEAMKSGGATDAQVEDAVDKYLTENPNAISAGIPVPATATVGQTIVVKAVDENGKPTEWETAELPPSALVLPFEQTGDTSWQVFGISGQDVKDAILNGQEVVAVDVDGREYPLESYILGTTNSDGNEMMTCVFSRFDPESMVKTTVTFDGVLTIENPSLKVAEAKVGYTVTEVDEMMSGFSDGADDSVYILADGETLDDAPADADVVIDPNGGSSGHSLGITGASVGQIAKITAVDENGVPTAWEPVDSGYVLPLLLDWTAEEAVTRPTLEFDTVTEILQILITTPSDGTFTYNSIAPNDSLIDAGNGTMAANRHFIHMLKKVTTDDEWQYSVTGSQMNYWLDVSAKIFPTLRTITGGIKWVTFWNEVSVGTNIKIYGR